ncbi:Hypothetical protein, putative [Bodo saltans]|uniref:Leucine-rich repeat protein n=1 Tax=Bodo saltans TaxID=75058 RepID=A0A0S4ISB6_BODSA|nr:Hypothetical protein, putative [Bodo saltans]|eukprot:CUE71703.1 Hypothetical protein, putative [Bodo saltans]
MALVISTNTSTKHVTSGGAQDLNERFMRLADHLADVPPNLQTTFTEACRYLGIEQEPLIDILVSSEPALCFTSLYVSKLHLLALAVTLPLRTWTTSIVMGAQRLDSSELQLLFPALGSLAMLSTFDISQNPIGSVGVMILVRLAQRCRLLKQVNIDGVEVVPSVRRKLEMILASR